MHASTTTGFCYRCEWTAGYDTIRTPKEKQVSGKRLTGWMEAGSERRDHVRWRPYPSESVRV